MNDVIVPGMELTIPGLDSESNSQQPSEHTVSATVFGISLTNTMFHLAICFPLIK